MRERWDAFCNWTIETTSGTLCTIALLMAPGILALVFVDLPAQRERQDRADAIERGFFVECRQHRPQYECMALWRVGARDGSTVIPIIIPAGR